MNLLRLILLSSHPVFRMPPAATSWASCLDDSLHFVFIVKPILCLIVNTVCVESWVGVCDEFKVREKNYKKKPAHSAGLCIR
ncbi:TPA: hypothetical protein MIB89_19985 [Klebsiella pneumoniae]|nr:hypothetical protein [Klebsiella pneumoniae]HBX7408901.1 hypothetical protein [Klebsiella pneumoniae]HBX7419488.1 hypothetical protein [Klebsiella pneumoniae]HBX7441556.1 hypothetical protein [Klebsiella pneumoniae]HBX7528878.1 hypothetical protein [Klebsiella pneumoniae]